MTVLQSLYYLDLLGTVVFAITGLLAASRKQLDLFGALFVALVTAVGGGTVRDLLLGQPVFWIQHNIYIYLVLITTLFVFFYSKRFRLPIPLLLYLDALGLAVFTVLGAQKSLSLDFPIPIVIMTAVMTGVLGGVIRDVLVGEVPLIFRKEIYATASFLGAILYVAGRQLPISSDLLIVISVGFIFIYRVLAVRYNHSLPAFDAERRN